MRRVIQPFFEWWYEFIASAGGIYLLMLSRQAYTAMRLGEKYAGGAAVFFLIWSILVYIALYRRIKWKLKRKFLMQETIKEKAKRLKDLKNMIEDAKGEGGWS